jgi:uncharacterized membrane protein
MDRDEVLRRLGMLFSLVGLAVSAYLIYIKFVPQALFCSGVGGCEAVNSSSYSTILGVPIALLGALAYITLLVLLLGEGRLPWLKEWGLPMELCLALAGTLYSAWLTYLELFVLHAVCPYCVTSAVMITLILGVTALRIRGWLGREKD